MVCHRDSTAVHGMVEYIMAAGDMVEDKPVLLEQRDGVSSSEARQFRHGCFVHAGTA